jgi:hypothetical protein
MRPEISFDSKEIIAAQIVRQMAVVWNCISWLKHPLRILSPLSLHLKATPLFLISKNFIKKERNRSMYTGRRKYKGNKNQKKHNISISGIETEVIKLKPLTTQTRSVRE